MCHSVESVFRVTRAVVLVNSEHMTAWNHRKRKIVHEGNGVDAEGKATLLRGELALTALVLTVRAKSPETFSHRRWAVERLVTMSDTANRQALVEEERRVCLSAADHYARNYYAWTHYLRVSRSVSAPSTAAERTTLQEYIERHIRDLSAMHTLLVRLERASEAQPLVEWTERLIQWNPAHNSALVHFHKMLLKRQRGL